MTLSHLLFSFEGRIGRQAYWFAVVILIAAGLVATIVDRLLFRDPNSFVSLIVALVSIYANVAVSVKRWHDRDKSGWWCLIIFIPFVGAVWILIENGFLKGTSGPNRYGPDPLG